MELFDNPNYDFLGKKWYLLALSLVLSVSGVLSMLFWHGIPLSIDFRGGTLVTVKFTHTPDINKIRSELDAAGLKSPHIQTFGASTDNEVLIALDLNETSEQALDQGKARIVQALNQGKTQDKADFNNSSLQSITEYLNQNDPLHAGTDANQRYAQMAQALVKYRDQARGGAISSLDDLKAVAPPAVVQSIQNGFSLSDFGVRNVDIVGPQVGKQLQTQAKLAVLYSLLGMLVYIAVRFEFIYGVAAVVAVFHDTLITVGVFSLLNKEISLTVIAAILTLVGYSMNDTIVVFDRIRENVKLLRRESYEQIVNKSINQTLNRTVLTSGLTFLTVLSLYLFGGEVLNAFSLALVIGILIGTYSSIFIASPMLVEYQMRRAAARTQVPVAAGAGPSGKEAARGAKARVKS